MPPRTTPLGLAASDLLDLNCTFTPSVVCELHELPQLVAIFCRQFDIIFGCYYPMFPLFLTNDQVKVVVKVSLASPDQQNIAHNSSL